MRGIGAQVRSNRFISAFCFTGHSEDEPLLLGVGVGDIAVAAARIVDRHTAAQQSQVAAGNDIAAVHVQRAARKQRHALHADDVARVKAHVLTRRHRSAITA